MAGLALLTVISSLPNLPGPAFGYSRPAGLVPSSNLEPLNDDLVPDVPFYVYQFQDAAAALELRTALNLRTVKDQKYLVLTEEEYRRLRYHPSLSHVKPERANYVRTAAYGTDDPYGNLQWNLAGENPGGPDEGMNWAGIQELGLSIERTPRVAVLDTGWTEHPDLPTPIAEYDFITQADRAADGGGRDSDARDPGDSCGESASSWHGTATAGVIAAKTNNGIGLIGVLPSVDLVVARVLGRCGGLDIDIADAIRWAAGGTVSGVPAIPKVDVMNLSLSGYNASCNSYFQDAVNFARSQGVMVIVAAGNDGADATKAFPGNCLGVLTVGSVERDHDIAFYSNHGPNVGILAPGGDDWGVNTIPTLSNTGRGGVGDPAYDFNTGVGTSFAAPHVAAAAAYIRSVSPDITVRQVAYLLAATSTIIADERCIADFADGTWTCASGILNLAGALDGISTLPSLEADQVSFNSNSALYGPAWSTPPVVHGDAVAPGGFSRRVYPGAWGLNTRLTFQWLSCAPGAIASSCTNIRRANSKSFYTNALTGTGKEYRVAVTAVTRGGTLKYITPPTEVFESRPVSFKPPAVSRRANVGRVLTATNGIWGGTAPITYSYRWFTCPSKTPSSDVGHLCTVIPSAESQTLAIDASQRGRHIAVMVSAWNSMVDDDEASYGYSATIGPVK